MIGSYSIVVSSMVVLDDKGKKMNLQEIRNQMWVVVNGTPLRKAKDDEVKRWAALRIIETLKSDSVLMKKTAKSTAS